MMQIWLGHDADLAAICRLTLSASHALTLKLAESRARLKATTGWLSYAWQFGVITINHLGNLIS